MACFDALSSIFLIIIRIKCKYIYIFLVNVAIIEGLNSMVTFWGPTIWFLKGVGVGGGLYGWFGLGKNFFFPNLWSLNLFPDTQRCKIFFPSIIGHERYFFSARIFSLGITLHYFFPSKSVCRIFISEITHTLRPPQKSNGRTLIISWNAYRGWPAETRHWCSYLE